MMSPAKLRKAAHAAKDEFRDYMSSMSRSNGFEAFAASAEPAEKSTNTNILGIGYGAREMGGGSDEDAMALRVYVRAKLPKSDLRAQDIVPPYVNGTATDVIPVGDIAAHDRPVKGGASIGHSAVNAGTLGCLVRKRSSSTPVFILSNNHILADCNRAQIADSIVEPGPRDGGTISIARLSDFEALHFDGTANSIDAAIAELNSLRDATAEIDSIGMIPTKPLVASMFQSVRKSGRTSLHTVGVIMDVSADVSIRYGNQIAKFEDLISIRGLGDAFSDGGDSGSLVVDGVTRRPVALLIGGSARITFACPIQLVLDRFDIEIMGADG